MVLHWYTHIYIRKKGIRPSLTWVYCSFTYIEYSPTFSYFLYTFSSLDVEICNKVLDIHPFKISTYFCMYSKVNALWTSLVISKLKGQAQTSVLMLILQIRTFDSSSWSFRISHNLFIFYPYDLFSVISSQFFPNFILYLSFSWDFGPRVLNN